MSPDVLSSTANAMLKKSRGNWRPARRFDKGALPLRSYAAAIASTRLWLPCDLVPAAAPARVLWEQVRAAGPLPMLLGSVVRRVGVGGVGDGLWSRILGGRVGGGAGGGGIGGGRCGL